MYQRYIKPIIDFSISVVCLPILLPIGLLIALIIKITSPGPVMFVQVRTGLKGKHFKMYKFRTMCATNDINDTSQDNKLTRFGRILRLYSLDEIPQIVNVLRGDMSLVGPRPWIPQYYENMSLKQRGRSLVKPGITGLAQASGRNGLTIHQKLDYDLKYVRNISFYLDIKVLYLTFIACFKRTGNEIDKLAIHNEISQLKYQPRPITDHLTAHNPPELKNQGNGIQL